MEQINRAGTEALRVGIDLGSTTTKIVALAPDSDVLFYSDYARHHAHLRDSLIHALSLLREQAGEAPLQAALTGSGARPLAEELGLPLVQEVAADAAAIQVLCPAAQTIIELGGQDAKVIFFAEDSPTSSKEVADMRMNGACAGGTGAFIDEMAKILHIPENEMNEAAEKGKAVRDISGRCGVFARADVQPLLNQGISRETLALSVFHAIARQTIGGLARGREMKPPIALAGGVATHFPVLRRVFAEQLELGADEVTLPEHPELLAAYGAALAGKRRDRENTPRTAGELISQLQSGAEQARARMDETEHGPEYFSDEAEKGAFLARHPRPESRVRRIPEGRESLRCYLGMDAGSTTLKFVLTDETGNLLWSFYAPHQGDPLQVAREGLIEMRDAFRDAGVRAEIVSAAATGYGEQILMKAFQMEKGLVETAAHAAAALSFAGDISFILDIGGQDMKAIWLDRGVITRVEVNEACSSGCGAFLENFAMAFRIPPENIAEAAFASRRPAVLGSRCTVFMNSSVITAQRNGSDPGDLMAGLCRSIIENVFTKVIRIPDPSALGDRIFVQGGTFLNDAVLRAMEEYTGKEVIRAPWPGLMGAIGAAIHARKEGPSSFIGLDRLESLTWKREEDVPCPFCENHCRRSVLRFSTGETLVTQNRCERGEILETADAEETRRKLKEADREAPNLFRIREKLVFQARECRPVRAAGGVRIGIPRVLSHWDLYPFWQVFWKSLGFSVLLGPATTRAIYESGLKAVASDTECLPAKLVHGQIRWLEDHGADRIFLPAMTALWSENTAKTSESMCALVKGMPLVIRNGDNPSERKGIPLDAPLFHWHSPADRERQLCRFMRETFGIPEKETKEAIRQGDEAQEDFRQALWAEGERAEEQVIREGGFAVILGARPYQNEPLIHHDLPRMFTRLGIPVLTADSVRRILREDLGSLRLDAVNNYHSRLLGAALLAARSPHLEYVQMVSFGCGHDAYLTDEITRVMNAISGKIPLILKLDESDTPGPLRIRVRSFLETLKMTSKQRREPSPLPPPYPVQFTRQDRKIRTLLVPNTSHAFSRVMAAALSREGVRTESLTLGRAEAIALGKRYVHNDCCFPAQIVIGEALAALKSGKYDPGKTAVGMAKYVGDCRLTHYAALLRKALDDAGFQEVPIWTNDEADAHRMHPGMRMRLATQIDLAFALPMMDAMEALLRRIRPYEKHPGETNRAFEKGMDSLTEGLAKSGVSGARKGFAEAVALLKEVEIDDSLPRRPRIVIVGEFLLNFHPGANRDIELFLEKNGFEIVEARMTDVIQKSYYYPWRQMKDDRVAKSPEERAYLETLVRVFRVSHRVTDRIAGGHPLYEKAPFLDELARESDPILPGTFDTGEGILIPAEIVSHANRGIRYFMILQPFGCLPNHVVGRGMIRKLQELYPQARILALDYDPDVSSTNIENRLQMLVEEAWRETVS